MASTTPVNVPARQWVNLYALSGIAVNEQVLIQNRSSTNAYIANALIQPSGELKSVGANLLRPFQWVASDVSPDGLWAYATQEVVLQVEMYSDGFKPHVEQSSSTGMMITDLQNRTAKISQKGEFLTGSCIDDVDINFQYTIRSAESVITETGTGTVTHPTGEAYAQLSAGSGVGKAQILSLAPVRYRAGHEVYCELSWVFSAPEPSNWNELAGFINDNDRWAVGYQNDVFGLMFREGGNDTFIPQSEFNIDKIDGTGISRFNINPQAINVYRLAFVWHGGLPLTLEVQFGQKWIPVHVLDFSNQITEVHLENPHLPIGGFVERTAGSGPATISRTGSWRGGAIAAAVAELSDDWTAHTVLEVPLSSNVRTNIFTIRNPAEWQGKQNHVVYELGVITFDSEANKTVAVYGTKGATVTGGGTPTFIDESNYAIQYINGGTVTGGARGPATVIKAGGDRRTDVRGTGIKIYPNEDFTIEVDPNGAVNGTFSVSGRFIHEG